MCYNEEIGCGFVITFLLPTLYFVRSGNIAIINGRLWDANIVGDSWPSTGLSRATEVTAGPSAHVFYFNATRTYPTAGPVDRWAGMPLRYLVSRGGRHSSGLPGRTTE